MSLRKIIVAGAGLLDAEREAGDHFKIIRAGSCEDVERLLDRHPTVQLVCTDVRLPDGNWCDVLRLVVNLQMTAEVRVLCGNGSAALRLVVRPHRSSLFALSSALHEANAAP